MKIDSKISFELKHPRLGSIGVPAELSDENSTPWRKLMTESHEICMRITACEVQCFYLQLLKFVENHTDIKSFVIQMGDGVDDEAAISVQFSTSNKFSESQIKSPKNLDHAWNAYFKNPLSQGSIKRFNNMQFSLRRTQFVRACNTVHLYTSMRNMFGDQWLDNYLDSTLGIHMPEDSFLIAVHDIDFNIPLNIYSEEKLEWMGMGMADFLTARFVKCSAITAMNRIEKVLNSINDDQYAIDVFGRMGKYNLRLVRYESGSWNPASGQVSSEEKLLKSGKDQFAFTVMQKLYRATEGRPFTKQEWPRISSAFIRSF